MVLEALVGRGLQHEPTSALEIARFLAGIATRMSDARATQVSREGRFDMAYEALLQMEELHALLLAWIRTHRPQWALAPTAAPPA